QNLLSRTDLVLEDMVNLRDPIFLKKDIELCENLTNNFNHSIESSSSINIDFDSESLVNL
ncbi:24583_t:CDS:1, partial [Racocetra persica]